METSDVLTQIMLMANIIHTYISTGGIIPNQNVDGKDPLEPSEV